MDTFKKIFHQTIHPLVEVPRWQSLVEWLGSSVKISKDTFKNSIYILQSLLYNIFKIGKLRGWLATL
jgi:hypothetical protein